MKLSKKIIAIFVLTIFIALAVFINTDASYNSLGIPFSSDLYYGRNYLKSLSNSAHLIAAYDEIAKGVQSGQEDILFTNKNIFVSPQEADFLLTVYRFDNPQAFFVEKYQYYNADQTGYSYGIHIVYDTELNTPEAKAQFNNALNSFLAKCNINSSMSQYQKSKILHDKMAEHITYKNTKNAHNIYGALVEASAVCDGYAELYQYLLYLNGISSHIATGKSNGEGHAWNLVRIDGKYYYTDVTWDDRVDMTYYGYFNITTKQISDDHTFDNNGYTLPICNSNDASYFNNSNGHGSMFNSSPDINDFVNQIKNHGSARLFYSGEGTYATSYLDRWINSNLQTICKKLGYSGNIDLQYKKAGRELIAYVKGETVTVSGDADGNGTLNKADAVYLLYNTLFGDERYPLSCNCDFNSDGKVTGNDVIYLNNRILYGQQKYPIN